MASSQPEALLDVVEGMGTVAPETLLKASSSLARPILLFCQWTQEAEVVGRFNQFYVEHAPAFSASDGEEEQDHVCYSIFRKYEEFFSSELESFLEERELIYLMPNSQPDVVRNEGQDNPTSSDQESRKSKKWTIPAVIVAIIIAIGIIYKLIKAVFK